MKVQIKKYIVGFIFVCIIIFAIGYRMYYKNKIKECNKISVGKILFIKVSTKNSGTHVEYFVDGKKYHAKGKIYSESLPLKNINVIYPCNNPSFGQVILTPDDFKEYDLPFPDSLNWILPYIENK